MRWQGRRGSRNIEDRRGRRGSGVGGGVGGLGIGGLLVVLVVGWVFGIDVSPLLSGGGGGAPVQQSRTITAQEQREAEFVSVVLADTEEVWSGVFRDQVGKAYRAPTLVLFSGVTSSPCGGASGATGPFYCPSDRKAYLDTAFFTTLEERLGAGGDFAAAYVVAHEVAHHVQNELGILGQANQIRAQASQAQSNAISVRIELQADCFSGIWAREAQERFGILERGDLEEAVNAARSIGDDRLQRSQGRVPMPHTFTHGTSEQRARWFARGYDTGAVQSCDTFSAERL
ncbi:KPN_02809 family neutral zinc metallopeptidase [Jannaschia donghaensis]|uniref:Putative metalloprotease n=1 Tax=Jannaschia donghaensis TaxID=420998 RepID=A0A0M6YJM8_9RHOB|nr:neutral zinc metallopeptidase [Jannaschia donghaensis]CTQ50561.1 putative metalloprotease [Jannaschia donghaensis]